MVDEPERSQAEALVETFQTTCDLLVRTALAMNDRRIARDVIDAAREIGEALVLARLELAVRSYEALGHSTTRLGEEMGITKQRADQIVKQAVKAGIRPKPKKRHRDRPLP